MTAEALQQERRRIGRKARRYATRNKKDSPAKFSLCEANHPGLVLQPNLADENRLMCHLAIPPRKGKSSLIGELMKLNKKIIALTASGLAVAAGNASAAVDAAVTTSLTTAGTDAATIGGAVLVLLAGILAFKLLRRAL